MCQAVEKIDGFKPFEVNNGDVVFSIVESTEFPTMESILYEFEYETECMACAETFVVKGYISEYPVGCIEHEEIEAYEV